MPVKLTRAFDAHMIKAQMNEFRDNEKPHFGGALKLISDKV